MSRDAAAAKVAAAGGMTATNVTRQTTHVIVGGHGWPLRSDGSVSARLQHAERLRARHGRPQILSERAFVDLLGAGEPRPEAGDADAGTAKQYTLEQAADLVGIDAATISRWAYLGLLRTADETCGFQDIVSLQRIVALVRDGVALRDIRNSLESLRTVVPDVEQPLAQLQIVADDDGALLVEIDDALVTPDGQQLLNFDETPDTGPVATIGTIGRDQDDDDNDDVLKVSRTVEFKSPAATDADMWFQRGLDYEELEQFDDAADAYRQVIAHDPRRSDAFFNLGNVLRVIGRAEAAEELYRIAVALEPDNELAWYNLADVLEESGRDDEAAECLQQVIELAPTFADAHFNLAGLLDHLGERRRARVHWQQYVSLDPGSEWAAVARQRLNQVD